MPPMTIETEEDALSSIDAGFSEVERRTPESGSLYGHVIGCERCTADPFNLCAEAERLLHAGAREL